MPSSWKGMHFLLCISLDESFILNPNDLSIQRQVLEKTLRILFETHDVSAVKSYICKQFTKVLSGRANIQDLIFAKEFRGINGYKPGACVPSLELTRYEKF